ncbi:MAG TPA: serine/threonine-protein kinase [Candidatus Xenobia bacterium]
MKEALWEVVPGTRIGDYKVMETLGRGGSSTVYRALDRRRQEVALKLYRDRDLVRKAERFWREIQIVQGLSHPGIVRVLDHGWEPWPFLVMELVQGATLKSWLKQAPPLQARRGMVTEVMAAVAYAHEQGVIHRDLKPDNVFVRENGRAAITDFGTAKIAGRPSLTTKGKVHGTPGYVSPEQLRGEEATIASDQYALGVLAFETLSGVAPFTGDSAVAVMFMQLTGDTPRLRDIKPDLPEPVDHCVNRMMARTPAQRFETVTQALAGFRSSWPDWIGPRSI